MTSFDDLLGHRIDFYGVDNNAFCISTSDGVTLAFEAVEDENDGYRSMLQDVKAVPLDGLIFFRRPIAQVTMKEVASEDLPHYSNFSGYDLVDDSGHIWLRIGTDNSDDYYPSFTFAYDPPRGFDVCRLHDECKGMAEMGQACLAAQQASAGPESAAKDEP